MASEVQKNSCIASSPEKSVLAYGQKHSCKGHVNEKKKRAARTPPPHNFSNGPSLTQFLRLYIKHSLSALRSLPKKKKLKAPEFEVAYVPSYLIMKYSKFNFNISHLSNVLFPPTGIKSICNALAPMYMYFNFFPNILKMDVVMLNFICVMVEIFVLLDLSTEPSESS